MRNPNSLSAWRHRAKWYRRLLRYTHEQLDQALADYDQVETELRTALENCTCTRQEQP